ncbi:hypothetical protein PUN4_550204 [Paraburkholderia unamae]|nr:hypothetical protein PUN4_550204 [Paraburkholderia unamae]
MAARLTCRRSVSWVRQHDDEVRELVVWVMHGVVEIVDNIMKIDEEHVMMSFVDEK